MNGHYGRCPLCGSGQVEMFHNMCLGCGLVYISHAVSCAAIVDEEAMTARSAAVYFSL